MTSHHVECGMFKTFCTLQQSKDHTCILIANQSNLCSSILSCRANEFAEQSTINHYTYTAIGETGGLIKHKHHKTNLRAQNKSVQAIEDLKKYKY